MANLMESIHWESSIYQLETTDPVKGGNDGISNLQGKQLANRTAYLKQQVELKAPTNSPTFTGVPKVPTAAADTNTTQMASTEFVIGQAATVDPVMDGVAAVGSSKKFARQDHVHPSDDTRASIEDVQKGTHIFALDTGVANAYICNFTPAITVRGEGQVIRFKVANTNAGASTINDGIGVVPLVGGAHLALQGGELVAGGDAWVQWNSTVGTGSYVLLFCSGASMQVSDGTKPHHAATVGQLAGLSAAQAGVSSGLTIYYPGTSGLVTVNANILTLSDGATLAKSLQNIDLTATSGSPAGVNSLDTGSWTFSTWYYLYVIYNSTTSTSALLWSLSPTSPMLPNGYTFFVRIGANRTQSADNYWLLGGKQVGKIFQPVINSSGNMTGLRPIASGTQGDANVPTYVPTSVSSFIPATALIGIFLLMPTTYNAMAIISPSSSYGGYGSVSNPPAIQFANPNPGAFFQTPIHLILESTNIYLALLSANLYSYGWEDNL